MALKYLDEESSGSPKLKFLDEESAAPAEKPKPGESGLASQIPVEESLKRPEERAARATGPRAEAPSLTERIVQNLYGVPVLAGGARLASLLSRGTRAAPYAKRFAEVMTPTSGRELARTITGVAGGTATAYGAGQLLPPTASPVVREGVEFVAGGAGELIPATGRQVVKAVRPLTQAGVTGAAERVVGKMTPEQILADPGAAQSRREIVEQRTQALRGKPGTEPADVTQAAALMRERAGVIRQRGTELGEQLAAGLERRLEDISRPRTATEVGEEARDVVNTRLQQLKQVRGDAAQKDLDEIGTIVANKENSGVGIESTKAFQAAKQTLKDKLINPLNQRVELTGPEAAAVAELRRDLTGTILDPMTGAVTQKKLGFAALDNLRRRLGDRAAGAPATGYDAIGQQQAKELKELVEGVMDEFANGKFKTYLDNYRKNSEPINQFEIKIGSKLTKTLERPRGEFETDPAALPKAIFSSRRNVDDFIELTGGDAARVENLARNYVSEQLQGKTAKQINDFLKLNKEWLGRFPTLRDDFTTYAKKMEQGARVQKRLGERTEARAARFDLAATPTEQAQQFRTLLLSPKTEENFAVIGRELGKTAEGRAALGEAFKETLTTTRAGEMGAKYKDRIRPAMQASGIYTPDQIAFIDDAVNGITQVEQAISRAMRRADSIPGIETKAQELTRLIQQEVNQMRGGAVVTSVLGGLALAPVSQLGGAGGALAGVAGATLLPRYRDYASNIRKAVSDIISDPQRLQQVLSAPPDRRASVLQGMMRAGLYSAAIVSPPEEPENATR